MNALTSGWTDQCVIVQRSDHRDPALPGDPWQIERQVQQVVHVQDVRGGRVEDVPQLRVDAVRRIRFVETAEFPVVHDFDDRQPLVPPPPQRTVGNCRIVFRCQNETRRLTTQLAGQFEGINLGSRAMTRQKIMDRVEDPHQSASASHRDSSEALIAFDAIDDAGGRGGKQSGFAAHPRG